MKKLYHIQTTTHVVVLASSDIEAKDIIEHNAWRAKETFDDADVKITKIKNYDDIPRFWIGTYPMMDKRGNLAHNSVGRILQEQNLNTDSDTITLNGKKYKIVEIEEE